MLSLYFIPINLLNFIKLKFKFNIYNKIIVKLFDLKF